MARAPRRRLPATEARTRILDAAERGLSEAGPEGLRLAELAKELGISHPAILHHFGSRDELVRAVVERALSGLHAELIAAFQSSDESSEAVGAEGVLHRVAETLADRGQARLMAWLILSGREPPQLEANVQLRKVTEGVHALRRAQLGNSKVDIEETSFFVQLTALALLADAVFGERLRKLEGFSSQPGAARDFRVRLASLLEEHLERETPPEPKLEQKLRARSPRKKRS